jgi:agmatinase
VTRDGHGPDGQLQGAWALAEEARISRAGEAAEVGRSLELGLEAAASVNDRTISCFSRGELPHFAGINTFLKSPYLEDVREVGKHPVAIMGVPFDTGTTYRPGARFGPQAMRRISGLYGPYSFELGVDLRESLDIIDLGDVFVIPANLEKSFDQITKAVSHVVEQGTLPVILGGDHSIGFPDLRGIARHVDGNVGIIHFDRHLDTQERDMDERMHTCPWYHSTELPNVSAKNLVQIGIGGWQVPRKGVEVARDRETTVFTVEDVERLSIERVAERALEVAWQGCKAVYLSFDVDCIECALVSGTGWPEPGGFLPREALKLVRLVAAEGICGMEVVEVSPPYDHADTTALMGVRVVLDVLATLVRNGKVKTKPAATIPVNGAPA